jgi:FdhE protein
MKREETEALNQRVGELVRLRPAYQEILEFYGAVMREHLGARTKFEGKAALTRDLSKNETKGDFPLFQRREIPINLEAAGAVFQSLCEVTKKQNETLRTGVQKIVEAMRDKKIDITQILEEMAGDDPTYTSDVCRSLNLDRDILVFLGRASVQPLVQEAALVLGEGIDFEGWAKGICPICGSLPILSELTGEEGRRMLICSLCGCDWNVSRLACPFCGAEKNEGHPYLFVEGDRDVRIDVCEECKRYIKTLDTRKVERAVFPLLEDVATLHLDMLAQEKGYKRGSAQYLEMS